MRIIAYLLIFILVGSAQAQMSCADVVSIDSSTAKLQRWRKAWQDLFREKLHGDVSKGDRELFFYWHETNPLNLQKANGDEYQLVYSNKRRRIYSNNPNPDSPNPLETTNTLFGRADHSNIEMIEAFKSNYSRYVSQGVMQAVDGIETHIQNLSDPRQSFGLVATAPPELGGRIIATFRVFKGTVSHSNTPAEFPAEYSFKNDNVQPEIGKKLVELRKKNPNQLLHEFGKFFVNADSKREAERARALLELFILNKYIDTVPADTIAIIHTVTPTQNAKHEQHYGFQVIENFSVAGQAEQDYILLATAKEMQTTLRRTYPLPLLDLKILGPK